MISDLLVDWYETDFKRVTHNTLHSPKQNAMALSELED